MIDTVESLKSRRNGKLARPNVRVRQTARDTTDAFLLLAAGLDSDEPVPRKLKLKVWHLAAVTLFAVGLLVAMRVW